MELPDLNLASGLTPAAVAYSVPGLGLVRVAGGDAIKVLGGLCTANLNALEVGGASEAFFADDRGRVLAHAVIARDADGAWIAGQIPAPAALASHIDKFIFREEATPRDLTPLWFGQLVDGSVAGTRLGAAAGVSDSTFATLGLVHLQIGELAVTVLRVPMTGPDARLCLVPLEHAAALEHALTSAQFELRGVDEFETRRIANFWPTAGHEISDRSLPQELDRDAAAISFTKGCYLGQETVARLDALGEVQKKLCLVRLLSEGEVAIDEPLMRDGKEVGKLTSVAPLTSEQSRSALAVMRRGSFAVGSAFHLGDVPGLVIAHP